MLLKLSSLFIASPPVPPLLYLCFTTPPPPPPPLCFRTHLMRFSPVWLRPKMTEEEQAASNSTSALVPITPGTPLAIQEAPIISSYNDRIHPLLNAVDKLRNMKVMSEGIELPTIVVIGDQSSGKSSVLESLAGISLPRRQGICTRVPLILRLQNQPSANMEEEMLLEYKDKKEITDEDNVAEAIESATKEIAGDSKGISNSPLVLQVKKHGVPDLTMVDLPGITRVAVRGQPENIYEQVRDIIMEYITPEESIILNVISAAVDFSTCESIRMSQAVDKTGQRTLAVVTKADVAPEGLLDKVTDNDVNIGLGFVCVRNRIGDESYEEARAQEASLFQTHPSLSKIDKSIVGIPVLAEKLVHIQATIISKCLPTIVRQINEKLSANMSELEKLPRKPLSVAEAMTDLMRIVGSSRESLKKIFIRGEYDEYPDDAKMHCATRLAEMLSRYSIGLHARAGIYELKDFMVDEIRILEEAKTVGLPNFLPRSAFLVVLRKSVNRIAAAPAEFVEEAWDYIERVSIKVLMDHVDGYPQLQPSVRRAVLNLRTRLKNQFLERVLEIVEMEKISDYTCNPEYINSWNKLMSFQDKFKMITEDNGEYPCMNIEGFGEVNIGHLRQYTSLCQEAFDLKMRVTAYMKIVLLRLVDCTALHLLLTVQNLVKNDMEEELVKEVMSPSSGGIEKLLDESPAVAGRRASLNKSIKLLKESRNVVGSTMDKIF